MVVAGLEGVIRKGGPRNCGVDKMDDLGRA